MFDIILETFLDMLKTMPLLFLIYIFLEYIQNIARKRKFSSKKLNSIGPLLGAGAGCIPQCGFSAVAATAYNEKLIRAGTLIAVFLATSDEAIPVLISSGDFAKIGFIILIKFVIGVIAGYLLNATLFRKESLAEDDVEVEFNSCEETSHHKHKESILKNAIFHTIKISAYILITMLAINIIIFLIGEEMLKNVLLSGSIFQPFISALIGLIPGCGVSVILAELLINGSITTGSAIAGLCTGAGFGYIIIIKKQNIKTTIKILLTTYICAVIAGISIDLLF